MKNYYDELEVSKTASKEVIEKVYKVLAKKYHPDTTKEVDKQAAEEKFKIISEAYEVLSNDEKRKKYDLELEQINPAVSYEEYINVVKQRDKLNNDYNNLKNHYNTYNANNSPNQYNYKMQYNQTNFNNTYNYKNSNSTSKNPKYYYTNTGKPASAFAYYKFKIKQFLSNIGFIILIIIALISAIHSLLNFSFL